jgi:hypothetical protein
MAAKKEGDRPGTTEAHRVRDLYAGGEEMQNAEQVRKKIDCQERGAEIGHYWAKHRVRDLYAGESSGGLQRPDLESRRIFVERRPAHPLPPHPGSGKVTLFTTGKNSFFCYILCS